MGCGGSKEDVASGNSIRRLLKRRSDVTTGETVASSSSSSCGGSKDDVASGNTIRRLLTRKSGVTTSETVTPSSSSSNHETVAVTTSNREIVAVTTSSTSEVTPADNVADVTTKVEPSPVTAPEVKVEQTVEEKDSENEEKVEARDIASDFFTPRKGADAARRFGSEGAEYYSPPAEPEVEKVDLENEAEGSNETEGPVVEATEVGEAEAVKGEDGLVSQGAEEPVTKDEDGEDESKDIVELKEEALVEEKDSDVPTTVVEEKSAADGEKSEDSLPDSEN